MQDYARRTKSSSLPIFSPYGLVSKATLAYVGNRRGTTRCAYQWKHREQHPFPGLGRRRKRVNNAVTSKR
ncbi:hypothetical protein DTO217A2_4526 [Paecilomyces variotii]|nr:hypothetical protein DTO217A2_4526 [Paecilomyces variotii]